jgi:hypothetical protein
MNEYELLIAIIYSCSVAYAAGYSLSLKHGREARRVQKAEDKVDSVNSTEHLEDAASVDAMPIDAVPNQVPSQLLEDGCAWFMYYLHYFMG